MNPELKAKWVANLRSGNFPQCTGTLRKRVSGFCCLGVALHTVDPSRWTIDFDGILHYQIVREEESEYAYAIVAELESAGRQLLGLTDEQERMLILLNDDKRWNFNQIAQWIEENI